MMKIDNVDRAEDQKNFNCANILSIGDNIIIFLLFINHYLSSSNRLSLFHIFYLRWGRLFI